MSRESILRMFLIGALTGCRPMSSCSALTCPALLGPVSPGISSKPSCLRGNPFLQSFDRVPPWPCLALDRIRSRPCPAQTLFRARPGPVSSRVLPPRPFLAEGVFAEGNCPGRFRKEGQGRLG